jgi:hypothetical protein
MRHILALPFLLPVPALAEEHTTAAPEEFDAIAIPDLTTERVMGTPLEGEDGARIGTIDHVVVIEDGPDKLVVAMGGYGDLSTRKVLFNLDDVRIEEAEDGTLTATTSLTRDVIDRLSDYESA